MKSASASIGATALAEEAAQLETAGKNGGTAFIRERLAGFRERLEQLTKRIEAALRDNGNGF
jgi:HPt (histidine-containing phosphotransfer) domain-containing protein